MSKRIITISREFGSGGRTIGKMVADQLGIAFYDKELIEKIAEETGFSKKFIEEYGEHAPGTNVFSYSFLGRDAMGVSMQDKIWMMQRKLILNLAEKESCVIVGRCASYILRDLENLFNVFIYADTKSRSERAVQEYHVDERRVEAMLRKIDKRRETFYSINTGGNWYDKDNYDLCLNSGALGLELCADIVVETAKKTIYR